MEVKKVSIVSPTLIKTKTIKTESKIKALAREHFYKYGMKRVTMDELASKAGVSKKTLYENFKDKNSLISAILDEDIALHKKVIKDINLHSDNAVDEIVKTMQYMADFFAVINPEMFYDLRKYHYDNWKTFEKFKEVFVYGCIERNLTRGIDEQLYRKMINTKLYARLRVAQMDMIFGGEVFSGPQFNFVEVHVEIIKHFLYGIATLKGHKMINKLLNIKDE